MTSKDVVATVLVALVVIPYIGYLVAGEMPFIKAPRGMAASALILGTAAALIAGRGAFTPEPWHRPGERHGRPVHRGHRGHRGHVEARRAGRPQGPAPAGRAYLTGWPRP
jgi:hypothetical protein